MDDELIRKIPRLYHFTDRRNLPSIREHGGIHSLARLAELEIEVPAPGGNEWSHDADGMKGLDKFVHLCLRSTHPMEFCARAEGRIGDTLFLEVHPSVLLWDDVLYSPDVSNKSGVEPVPIKSALELIDFEVLYTRTDWKDPAIQERLQNAEKSEVLVPDSIPLDLIRNFPNG